MNVSLYFLLCVTASIQLAVQAAGLKILGGYVTVKSADSSQTYGNSFEWGQYEVDGNSREILTEKMYCWIKHRNHQGFCYHYLVVSTSDDPNEEHYQIIGSYQKIYDGEILVETKNINGITEERFPYQKIKVANAETWSGKRNRYMYGDLFFFANRTTQPSITDDISYIVFKGGDHSVHKEEMFLDSHEPTSVKVTVSGVRTWTKEWSPHSYYVVYFWRAPTTLISAETLKNQVNVLSHDYSVKKLLVLRNKGSGVTSPDFPILGTTQTITTTSESRFLRNWDFSFSLEQSISISGVSVSAETTISTSFSYHNENEMTQTKSVETTVDIKWPSECPAGFRITYEVIEITEEQEIPVKLRFRRAGVVWTEIDIVRVKLRKLVLTKDDCCLFEWADTSCGSESLDMCEDLLA